jgi:Dynamin family/Dynamin central region
MVSSSFHTDALSGLCTKDQLKLLDSIDSLRSLGISHYVSLPQIIVCGDQLSGKSSVLEAISGVSLPIKSSLCTRFPIELVLRKTSHTGLNVSIVPDQSRSEAERHSLGSFSHTLDRFDGLPALIENAQLAMGISTHGKSFAKDLLRVEISGPDQPHLTIVDLPGLVHSQTKQQTSSDVALVKDVVQTYMKEPRSIILAVISAKNDYANQIVLSLARDADPEGTRTLGVITKPDTLIPGSGSEETYVALAQNHDIEFRLGWHVLKNMDSEQGASTLKDRDAKEAEFFAQGVWQALPRSFLGIVKLRKRLSEALVGQIATELPSLVAEIESKSETCRRQLEGLGQPRANLDEQRTYLVQISQKFQSLVKESVDGTYRDQFFGDARSDTGYKKRIRAIVQNISSDFSRDMTENGHYCQVVESESDTGSVPEGIVALTRADYIVRVWDLIKRTRGRELPSMFNPMIVEDLFVEQSSPWEGIANTYIRSIWQAAREFVSLTAGHVADSETSRLLSHEVFQPVLNGLMGDLTAKTAELLRLHRACHPITYNQDFVNALQTVRKEREEERVTEIMQKSFNVTSLNLIRTYDLRPLAKALVHADSRVESLACSDALDCMEAYYKVSESISSVKITCIN